MNNLSLFLYMAEVIPRIGLAASGFAWGLLVMGGAFMGVWTFAWQSNQAPKPRFGIYFTALFVCAFISAITPSKEIIYLIAGSQVGEYVVNTPEGQEILNDIHKIIKMQLSDMVEGVD